MNAVEIDGLTYTYPGAPQPTLKEISLQIEKGDFLAVVGNNGCGKSTLCKVLNGLIPHFITGIMEGSARVEGLDTRESDVGVLAQKVGYVYQDFENQIVRPTVLDDASYACLNYAFPDYLARGRTALRQCGLEGREEEYVWQLDGVTVDTESVESVLSALTALQSTGTAQEAADEEAVLRVALLRESDSFDRVEIAFYAYDAENYLYELLGERRLLVDAGEVDAIARSLKYIASP